MKTINVSAGVIHDNNKILATRRKGGTFDGMWEFPGGKREEGETGRDTIIRELKEELEIKIEAEKYLGTIEYQYSDFYLIMDVYLCSITEGVPVFKVHDAGKWLDLNEIDSIEWLPADILALDLVKKEFVL